MGNATGRTVTPGVELERGCRPEAKSGSACAVTVCDACAPRTPRARPSLQCPGTLACMYMGKQRQGPSRWATLLVGESKWTQLGAKMDNFLRRDFPRPSVTTETSPEICRNRWGSRSVTSLNKHSLSPFRVALGRCRPTQGEEMRGKC